VDQLTTTQRGAVAESAFATAALELGISALRPICEGRRYDLVLDLRLLRVQCKLALQRGGALVIRLKTNRCTPDGYLSTSYTADEVDAIGAYSPELRRCFLLPISEACNRRVIHLRLVPAKNNQAERVKWARDYALDSMLIRLRSEQTPHLT
jgi:hypothetical protein